MEKRKSLRELKSIVKGKKEELEKNIDDIVQHSDLSNPQVKEIIAKLQGEIEVMEGIILYCTLDCEDETYYVLDNDLDVVYKDDIKEFC